MKLIRIPAIALFSLLTVTCTELREGESFSSKSQRLTVDDELQKCIDSKMAEWYKAFNHYQLEGYNIFAADLKALQEANMVYKNCRAQSHDSIP